MLNFSRTFKQVSYAAAFVAFALPAQAVVISSVNTVLQAPSGPQAMADLITGPGPSTDNFRNNFVGNDLSPGLTPEPPNSRSPYDNTMYQNTAPYNSVSAGSSATFFFNWNPASFALMWGSPDSYNFLDFFLDGDAVGSFDGTDLVPPATSGLGFANVVFSGSFDQVVFRSVGQDAFEFTNMQVPEPGSLALLGLGLAGLAAAARRKQKQA